MRVQTAFVRPGSAASLGRREQENSVRVVNQPSAHNDARFTVVREVHGKSCGLSFVQMSGITRRACGFVGNENHLSQRTRLYRPFPTMARPISSVSARKKPAPPGYITSSIATPIFGCRP